MSRGKPPAAAIEMHERIYDLLYQESCKRTIQSHHRERINIILMASHIGGGHANGHIERTLSLAYNTVKTWRNRWSIRYPSILTFEKGQDGTGVSDTILLNHILSHLEDEPRPGAPKIFTTAQVQQISAIACQKPSEHGFELTNWSHGRIAQAAIAKGIVETISPRYVGILLKKMPA